MTAWEYRLETLFVTGTADRADKLNELGAEGWELVAILPSPTDGRRAIYHFKRPKVTT